MGAGQKISDKPLPLILV